MPAFEIRERLVPYRVLAYLLYSPTSTTEWLEDLPGTRVRITTGAASRDLRLKNTNLWDALYWLRDNKLVSKVEKEKKRGTAIIHLLSPPNIEEASGE